MKESFVIRLIQIPLTEEEKAEIGRKMTVYALEIKRIEEEKKRLKMLQSEITTLAEAFERGKRDVEARCRVHFNEPAIGQKTIVVVATGEVVAIEDMTPEELQEDIPFTEATVVDDDPPVLVLVDETHMLEAPAEIEEQAS